jgi:GNAT superfamily N-acetyltransferase
MHTPTPPCDLDAALLLLQVCPRTAQLAAQPIHPMVLMLHCCINSAVAGVPEDDAAGCYLLNVVVNEDWRGQGIGKALMAAAMAQAVHTWGAQQLYTHVEADNEVR